jgi:hypothetical protein
MICEYQNGKEEIYFYKHSQGIRRPLTRGRESKKKVSCGGAGDKENVSDEIGFKLCNIRLFLNLYININIATANKEKKYK